MELYIIVKKRIVNCKQETSTMSDKDATPYFCLTHSSGISGSDILALHPHNFRGGPNTISHWSSGISNLPKLQW